MWKLKLLDADVSSLTPEDPILTFSVQKAAAPAAPGR